MVSVKKVIAILNEINELDTSVLPALISHRVSCNKALGQHPTVQVGYINDDPKTERYEVGFLGILNGLFGTDENGWGHIYVHLKENGSIDKFSIGTHEEHKVG